MLMADTMAIFFVVLGFLLAFPGLWLLVRGLWPRTVANAAAICRKGLIRAFLFGLPITAFAVFATAVLSRFGTVGKISATALFCFYLIIGNCGVAGLATLIGERLASQSDTGQEWRATLRGGIVLELGYLPPILGWFGILPLSLVIGCGAAVIAILKKRAVSGPVANQLPPQPISDYRVNETLGAER